MRLDSVKKFVLPPGPILSLTLIGLLLLSAILYYRAVRIQRFLEPALAVTQPRMHFTQNIVSLIQREFGPNALSGIKFRSGSIFIEQSLLFASAYHMKDTEQVVLKKLGRIFLKALDEPSVRERINIILVGVRMPLGPEPEQNRQTRFQVQERARLILNSLFAAEPRLETQYGAFFVSAAIPVGPMVQETTWIEFRIVPTERLHIEVLQRLGKYMR